MSRSLRRSELIGERRVMRAVWHVMRKYEYPLELAIAIEHQINAHREGDWNDSSVLYPENVPPLPIEVGIENVA